MPSAAVANTAKVGDSPVEIATVTGSLLGAAGLVQTDVTGSVWHRLKVIGKTASPVSVLTLMVAEDPTLIVAAVKKPLLAAISITPFAVVVATNAIRSGAGVVDADSSRVLRPTKLAASLVFEQRNTGAICVGVSSCVGVMPNTND